MVFDTLLDPVFRPLLSLPPFWGIFLIAFVITLAITLVFKYATDQKRMKELKVKVKESQEKMKKARDDPKKLMAIQQEAMKHNMELMKHSFKPTLYTFIPIIIIFGWLNANMAYYNLSPAEEFTLSATFQQGVAEASLEIIPAEGMTLGPNATQPVVDGVASWSLSGAAGTYKATVTTATGSAEKTFLISDERKYVAPLQAYKENPVTSISLGNRAVKPLEPLSLFGWRPGWLGTYIILSIILSMLLRKALGVV